MLTTIRASSMSSVELSDILADYLALDRARVLRRLLVVRCALLALGVVAVEALVPGFSRAARLLSPALIGIPACWAWIAELRLASSLGRRLGSVEWAVRKS